MNAGEWEAATAEQKMSYPDPPKDAFIRGNNQEIHAFPAPDQDHISSCRIDFGKSGKIPGPFKDPTEPRGSYLLPKEER